MKKNIISSLAIFASLSLMSGCAYKTVSGIDQCGQSYTDTTFRSYSDNCKAGTYAVTSTSNCTLCQKPAATSTCKPVDQPTKNTPILKDNKPMRISVVGQGVSPTNTISPAQAYALAKRAAVADAYRLIAEKVKGVRVEGKDLIKNMMVKRSSVRTSVSATIRNSNIVETTFKDGLCEVEMEIVLSYADFSQ